MRRHARTLLAVVVVLAALAGGVSHVGAAPAAAGATAQEDCSFPTTLTDSSGTEVTLEEEPDSVVALGASSAQTIWELGEADRVVGMPVDQSTADLEGSQERTHVLDGVRVDTEAVVDLDPDLVIAPSIINPDDVAALRDAGLTVYGEADASSIGAVEDSVETTGRLLGACDAADETTAWMNERLEIVDAATANAEERPTVFYWLGDGFTAGSGTFQGDLLERAGATNAAAEMGVSGWAGAEPEAIVAEDPDYFLVSGDTSLPEDHPVQQTTAAQEGNVVSVDANDWNQPAPRVVLAVESMTEQLHPEAYENAVNEVEGSGDDGDGASGDGESGDGESGTEASGDDGDSSEESSDGGSSGLPGFGVPAAVAALLAALGVLGRRRA